MNETLLSSIDKVRDNQDDSQFDIYCAIGDELVKEFFIEQTHQMVYTEGASTKKKEKGPLNEEGRVPTLQKLADWFVRFITRLRAMWTRKHNLKTLERIKNSDRYKDNDQFQLLMWDPRWYLEVNKLGDSADELLVKWRTYLAVDRNRVLNVFTQPDFKTVVKETYKLRKQAEEVWDDVKNVSAVNDKVIRCNMSKHDLDVYLRGFKKHAEDMEKEVKDAFDAKDRVKQICQYLTDQDVNMREDMNKLSEQYVKFITDLLRSWLCIAQVYMRTAERIHYSLGRPQSNNGGGDV